MLLLFFLPGFEIFLSIRFLCGCFSFYLSISSFFVLSDCCSSLMPVHMYTRTVIKILCPEYAQYFIGHTIDFRISMRKTLIKKSFHFFRWWLNAQSEIRFPSVLIFRSKEKFREWNRLNHTHTSARKNSLNAKWREKKREKLYRKRIDFRMSTEF